MAIANLVAGGLFETVGEEEEVEEEEVAVADANADAECTSSRPCFSDLDLCEDDFSAEGGGEA